MEGFNDVLQDLTKGKFDQYFFMGWEGEKWLMTCSQTFDKDKMSKLRDYLSRTLEQENSHG